MCFIVANNRRKIVQWAVSWGKLSSGLQSERGRSKTFHSKKTLLNTSFLICEDTVFLPWNTNEEDHYCVYIGVKNPPIWLVCAFKKLWIICEVMYFLIESIFGLVMSMGLASHWIKGFDCAKLHNLYPTSKVNNKQAAKSMHTQAFSLPHSFHYCLSQPTVSSLFISLTLPLYCMRVIGETSFANVTQYIKRNMVLLFRSWLGRL